MIRRIVLATIALVVASTVYATEAGKPPAHATILTKDDAMDLAPYVEFLQAQSLPAVQYVVSEFAEHDIVILGEMHEVKENLALVSKLVRPLYAAGIRTLCMETIRHAHTARANRLVTAPAYDEEGATDLLRHNGSVIWGFAEYRDVLRSVWQLNSVLPSKAPKFRIVGLDNGWDRYWVECGSGKRQARSQRLLESRDLDMAEVVEREVLTRGGKALVLVGYAHSFTKFATPGRSPMGYLLAQRHHERIFQICLHQPHIAVAPAEGRCEPLLPALIEAVAHSSGLANIGWDIADSPFANLRDPNSVYFAYRPDLVFSDVAEGYVFLAPLAELNRITWIPGFINQDNFSKANAIAVQRGWLSTPAGTPEALDTFLRQVFEAQ